MVRHLVVEVPIIGALATLVRTLVDVVEQVAHTSLGSSALQDAWPSKRDHLL